MKLRITYMTNQRAPRLYFLHSLSDCCRLSQKLFVGCVSMPIYSDIGRSRIRSRIRRDMTISSKISWPLGETTSVVFPVERIVRAGWNVARTSFGRLRSTHFSNKDSESQTGWSQGILITCLGVFDDLGTFRHHDRFPVDPEFIKGPVSSRLQESKI